jgi:glycosyltransferase involved in cell wall biosynthesis
MSEPIRVLELRSVRGTGGGPEKTILLGTARTDRQRFAITVCYIRDARDTVFSIDAKAAALPVEYVELFERHSFDPGIWPALRRIVRERRIDIVHSHDYKTNLLARLLEKTGRATALSTVHGWTGHSWRERRLYYPLDKRVLSTFTRLIAVSSEIRSELIAAGAPPENVSVVLNGIDHRVFKRDRAREAAARADWGFSPSDVVIGAVGRTEPQKRFDLLIEAVAGLMEKRPGLRLLIAGDGSRREALEALARTRLPQHVYRFIGNTQDVGQVHHAVDVFVQSSDYEGTPNAVLEAMAFETPIVATDVGGTAELVSHAVHGLIVPPRDPARLAGAIEDVLADPVAARERVTAARRRVEHELSFDARMRSVEAIYSELQRTTAAHRRVRRVDGYEHA